jgi:hypothetical protein
MPNGTFLNDLSPFFFKNKTKKHLRLPRFFKAPCNLIVTYKLFGKKLESGGKEIKRGKGKM